jgi:hypothetical protein
MIALHVGNPKKAGDGRHVDGESRRTQHHGMSAVLMRLHDLAHVRVDAWGNAFHEQSGTQLVELGDRLPAQITRSPRDELLKLHATESIPQRGFHDSQELANPGLPTPDSIADVRRCGEAVNQRAVQVEERPDPWSGRTGADLRDGIGGESIVSMPMSTPPVTELPLCIGSA